MADEPKTPANEGGLSIKRLGVWVILIALAAVFGLSFGLPSDSLSFGPQPLARVHGHALDQDDFTYQLNAMTNFLQVPSDERTQELMGLRQQVLESVVERIVMAQAAEDMGLRAVTRDAEELTYNGNLILLGETFPWLGRSEFNYNMFAKSLLPALAVSEKNYLEHQRQEILARTARDVIAASVVVPEAEVRAEYDKSANKLSLRYVRFSNAHYAELVDPSPEEIDGYVAQHADELEAAFTSQGSRFTKLPKQVRLRYIKVPLPAALPEDADADAKAKFAEAQKAARSRIEDARKRLGAEDFRVVARELSQDPATARAGGDYGWVSVEGTGSGLDPVVDEAAAKLEDGDTSSILEGEDALWLVHVAGHREGDVPKEVALRELAEERLKQDHGKSLAKQAAEEALLALKGGKSMADLFDTPDALGGGGIESLPIGGDPTASEGPIGQPQMRVTGLFAKDKTIPGIGAVPDLTQAAWEADDKAEVIPEAFEVADGWIVAGIDQKESGSDEGFAEQRDAIARALAESKARRITSHFAHRRCLEAKGRGEITTNDAKIKALMTYDTKIGVDEAGNPVMKPYSMCERVGTRGGMLNPAMMFGAGR
jgi:parvulin-like peptidyl-prolyl isomerase